MQDPRAHLSSPFLLSSFLHLQVRLSPGSTVVLSACNPCRGDPQFARTARPGQFNPGVDPARPAPTESDLNLDLCRGCLAAGAAAVVVSLSDALLFRKEFAWPGGADS